MDVSKVMNTSGRVAHFSITVAVTIDESKVKSEAYSLVLTVLEA